MLELFYYVKATNIIFTVLVANINDLGNLVSLNKTTQRMFDTGHLTVTLFLLAFNPVLVFNEHSDSYLLIVSYPYDRLLQD